LQLSGASRYLSTMARRRTDGFIAPCIPTRASKPPAGPDWVHEIKHDGYRLIVRGAGPLVRLFTRRGFDWTDRYPAIAGAAAKLGARSFTIDGEAVVCGPDRIAVFDALHHRHKTSDAIVYAFDLLELDGEDLRPRPLSERKRGWRSFWLQGRRHRLQRAPPATTGLRQNQSYLCVAFLRPTFLG
jgi:ATP-dependent DNA ligase